MAVSTGRIQGAWSGARKYLPRTRRGWLVAIVAPILLIVLMLYIAARMAPSWYRPLDPSSQSVIDAADIGWHKMSSELHNSLQRVPLGDQIWSISQTEVNSLLAVRLPAPEQAEPGRPYPVVSAPFVLFSEGKVTIAARTTKLPGPAPGGGVASVTISVQTIPTGPASAPNFLVRVEGTFAGRLRIPQSIVENRVRSLMPALVKATTQTVQLGTGGGTASGSGSAKTIEEIEKKITAIQRGEPFPLTRSYDGRMVVVKDIRLNDGSLTVIFGPPVPAGVRPRPLP